MLGVWKCWVWVRGRLLEVLRGARCSAAAGRGLSDLDAAGGACAPRRVLCAFACTAVASVAPPSLTQFAIPSPFFFLRGGRLRG